MEKYLLELEIANPNDFSDNKNNIEIIDKIIKYIIEKNFEFFDEMINIDYSVKYKSCKNQSFTIGFLIFEISLKSLKKEFVFEGKDMSEYFIAHYVESETLKFTVKEFLANLLMCINITYPGIFLLESALLKSGEKIMYTFDDMNPSNMIDLYSEFEEQKWIKLTEVTLEETWGWLKNRTSFLNGKIFNNIDKSLNAFSYVFGAENFEELFYCLMAIETLYNTNRNITVQSQIKTKLFSLFGETKEIRKKINDMYDKRSRIVHGDITVPKKNYANYEQELIYSNFFEIDFLPATITAEMIYIATLHLFIKNDSSFLVEEFKLKFV